MPVEFVGGLRVSDPDTVEVAKMVLVGKVNKDIVLRLNRHGQPAVGLSGDDGGLFRVARQAAPDGDGRRLRRADRARRPGGPRPRRRRTTSRSSRRSAPTREGNSYNVNADEAAGAIARALGAYKVMFLTDVEGWLRDPARPEQRRLARPRADEVEAALAGISGGMRPKLAACLDAIHGGVQLRAHRRRARAALAAARAVHRTRASARRSGRPRERLERCRRSSASTSCRTYARLPVAFVRGEGARLWDADGAEYLDFLTGIAVNAVGHCHPRVVAAIREQAGRLIHVGNLFYTEPGCASPQRLAASSLGGKVFFANSGTEAVEAALKLARKARPGGDDRLRAAAPSTGARTASLSATPQESKQAPFAPLVPGLRGRRAEAEAVARARSTSGPPPSCSSRCRARPASTSLPDELLRAARAACDEHGAALIFDEVQCGLGRTGPLWAYEHSGVVPDALTTAKALGGGLPIGALVTAPAAGRRLRARRPRLDVRRRPGAGAAGLAVLDVLDDEALLARVRALGEQLLRRLAELPARDGGPRPRPDARLRPRRRRTAPELVERALLRGAPGRQRHGPGDLRLLPPLTIVRRGGRRRRRAAGARARRLGARVAAVAPAGRRSSRSRAWCVTTP